MAIIRILQHVCITLSSVYIGSTYLSEVVDESCECVVSGVSRHLVGSEPVLRDCLQVAPRGAEAPHQLRVAVLGSQVERSCSVLRYTEQRV